MCYVPNDVLDMVEREGMKTIGCQIPEVGSSNLPPATNNLPPASPPVEFAF